MRHPARSLIAWHHLLAAFALVSVLAGCASTTHAPAPLPPATAATVAPPPPSPPPRPTPAPAPAPTTGSATASLNNGLADRFGAMRVAQPPARSPVPPPASAVAPQPQERYAARESFAGLREFARPPEPAFTRIEVEFATNRAPGGGKPHLASFSGAQGSSLLFGKAIVTVPYRHREGTVELPAWYNPFGANPARHFTIESADVVSAADWEATLRAATSRSGANAVLLFVHGYKNSFDDALFRTAQIAYDVHFKGAVAMFSWPSVNRFAGYMEDYRNAEWSIPVFAAALKRVIAATHSSEIYIIAHSMGNQVVTRGLAQLVQDDPSVKGRVRELILAAPDIDAAMFKRDIAPFLAQAAQRTTLYASSKDYALFASRKLQGYSRAGDTVRGVLVVPPIQTVDASRASADFLGHSYVADSQGILADIAEIIGQHLPPARRGLTEQHVPGGDYWVYTAH
jgi:esterase/lipase superfamily enzyme